MPTVYERCVQAGVTDHKAKARIGEVVTINFHNRQISDSSLTRERVRSIEPEGIYQVWYYPESFTATIDQVIQSVSGELNERALMTLRNKSKQDTEEKRKRPRIQGRRVDRG